jgi:peroxiredoxin
LPIKAPIIIVVTALILISAIGCGTATIPQVGDKAPAFTLESIDGKNISLSDFQGKIVLIVFTKINCAECLKQIPYIKEVYEHSTSGLIILDVYQFDAANKVKEYVESNQLTAFPALPDPGGEITSAYGVGLTPPTNFIIDRNGIIVMKKIGPFESEQDIEDVINSL